MKEKIGSFAYWLVTVIVFAVVFAYVVGGIISKANYVSNEIIAEQSKTIEALELKNITLQEMLIDANDDYFEVADRYWELWDEVSELERLMGEWEE